MGSVTAVTPQGQFLEVEAQQVRSKAHVRGNSLITQACPSFSPSNDPRDLLGLPQKKEPSVSGVWISPNRFFLLGSVPTANYPVYIVLNLLPALCHKNVGVLRWPSSLPVPAAQSGIHFSGQEQTRLLRAHNSRGRHLCLVPAA